MQFNSSTAEEEIGNRNCTFNVRTGHLSLSKFGTFCWIGQPVESETKKKPVHWSVFGYCHMRKWIIDICIHDYCYQMLEVIRCSYIFLMHMLLILTEGSCICLQKILKCEATKERPKRKFLDGFKNFDIPGEGTLQIYVQGQFCETTPPVMVREVPGIYELQQSDQMLTDVAAC